MRLSQASATFAGGRRMRLAQQGMDPMVSATAPAMFAKGGGTRLAQQGIDLMVVFATALAMFVLFYALFAQQYGESMRRQAESGGVNLAERLAGEINIAARAGDGYSRRVSYPTRIPGAISYSMEINNRSGSVDISMAMGGYIFYHSAPALTRNITGEPQYESANGYSLLIARGATYIENRGGVIVINQTKAV